MVIGGASPIMLLENKPYSQNGLGKDASNMMYWRKTTAGALSTLWEDPVLRESCSCGIRLAWFSLTERWFSVFKVTSIHFQDTFLWGILWGLNKHSFLGLASGPPVCHGTHVKSMAEWERGDKDVCSLGIIHSMGLWWRPSCLGQLMASRIYHCFFFLFSFFFPQLQRGLGDSGRYLQLPASRNVVECSTESHIPNIFFLTSIAFLCSYCWNTARLYFKAGLKKVEWIVLQAKCLNWVINWKEQKCVQKSSCI